MNGDMLYIESEHGKYGIKDGIIFYSRNGKTVGYNMALVKKYEIIDTEEVK